MDRKGGEEVHLTLDLLPFVRELCLGSDLRSLRPKALIATWLLADCGKVIGHTIAMIRLRQRYAS